MTETMKIANKKSANETGHRRAMANPKVLELISCLERDWTAMDLPGRGQRLRQLTALGCSTRGLETELKQSATNIRRSMKLAELPKRDCNVQATGVAARELPAQKTGTERDKSQQQRINEDRKTGALSNEVASMILEFCRAKERPPETPILKEDVALLLTKTDNHLIHFEATGRRAVCIPKDLGAKELFSMTQPPKEENDLGMDHQGKWLANVVWLIAPERPIWESALRKSEGRAGELTPKKAPIDIWSDNMRRLAENSDPPFRPQNEATRCLGRQGKPVRP